jgi:medium-chain acyl-[acyl-carrier-protein] hydrolase
MDTRDDRWLMFGADERKLDARIRLFCFHYAGSGGSMFSLWPASLPPEVELVAVQLPGRENRIAEPLLYDMDEVAPPIADAMASLLDKPFAIFGHSTGALIGFEVTRVLRQRGLPQPHLLMASSQNAPEVKPPVIRHTLSDPEFIEVLRGCNGTPDAILRDPVLLDFLLPRIRADGAIFENYRYRREAPLDCRIVVFHGSDDAMVDDDGLARWEHETRHSFSRHSFPGDHFFIHSEEASVLKHINRELAPLLSEAASTIG